MIRLGDTVSPAVAKSVLLLCPLCNRSCEAVFPWGSTNAQRMLIRHNVIEEHRRVCTADSAEVQRVYTVNYARE